ncbi:MAG: class I SAM-dependent methyltransferase [Acidobacteriota bacterium]
MLDSKLRRLVAGPERLLREFGVRAGERILEVGPGSGYYSLATAQRLQPDGHLICLDIQQEMLAATRERFGMDGRAAADFLRADAGALPLASDSIDRVLLIGVLGEFPDRRRALDEIARVLRPMGRLSVCEQLPDPDFVTKRTLRSELGRLGFSELSTRGHAFYTSTWSASAGK